MTKPTPLLTRLLNKLQVSTTDFYNGTPCIDFMGCRHKQGYGQIRGDASENGRVLKAHRVAYVLLVGPIPDGLLLDHLCDRKMCCNPDHLEAVDHAENITRSYTRIRATLPSPLSDFSEEF